MSYQELACLVLKTNVLTTNGTTNAFGSGNSTLSSFTWTNINLRTLLGDMFDKYDRYLLLLQNISHSLSTAIAGGDDRSVLINMSGLSFVNSTYIQKLQSNSGALIVCPFIFPSAAAVQSQLYNNFAVSTFIKQNDIVNISINYTKIKDDSATTVTYPHMCFIFNIVGIEEYRIKDVMNTRLLK